MFREDSLRSKFACLGRTSAGQIFSLREDSFRSKFAYLGRTAFGKKNFIFREDSLRSQLEDIEADFEAFLDELVTILFEATVVENKRYIHLSFVDILNITESALVHCSKLQWTRAANFLNKLVVVALMINQSKRQHS